MKYLHIVRLLGAVLLTLTSFGIAGAQAATSDVVAALVFLTAEPSGRSFTDSAGHVHTLDTVYTGTIEGDLDGTFTLVSSSVIKDGNGPFNGQITITTAEGTYKGRFAGHSVGGCNTAHLVAHGTGDLVGQTLKLSAEELTAAGYSCTDDSPIYSLVGTRLNPPSHKTTPSLTATLSPGSISRFPICNVTVSGAGLEPGTFLYYTGPGVVEETLLLGLPLGNYAPIVVGADGTVNATTYFFKLDWGGTYTLSAQLPRAGRSRFLLPASTG